MRTVHVGWALAACLAVFCAMGAGCRGGKPDGPPKIKAAEGRFGFGRVKQGSEVEHVFKIGNAGKGDLRISQVKASRQCAVTAFPSAPLAPGDEGDVKVVLKTGKREGRVSCRVTVVSNDKAKPKLKLALEGEVFAEVSAKPKAISFGQIGRAGRTAAQLSLAIAEPGKIKVTGVAAQDPRFAVTHKSGDPSGAGPYEVAFTGGGALGRVATKIAVTYAGGDLPAIEIPCTADVVGDLNHPHNLLFRKKDGAFPVQQLVFTSRSGKDVEIKRVEDPDGKLEVKIATAKGKSAVVSLAVAKPGAAFVETDKHTLRVTTTDADEPVVEISYGISPREVP